MNKEEKAKEILKAITDVNDEYVEEAIDATASENAEKENVVDFPGRSVNPAKKWRGLAVAACLVLVVGFGIWKIAPVGDKASEDSASTAMSDEVMEYADDTAAEEVGAEDDRDDFESFGRTGEANGAIENSKGSEKADSLTDDVVEESSEESIMNEEDSKKLMTASLKLFDQIAKSGRQQDNVLISPTSILYAFGMLENGVKGETLSQLTKAINDDMDVDSLNESLSKLKDSLESSQFVKWNVANSLWIKDDKSEHVKKDYLSGVKRYYGAEVYKTPFDADSPGTINKWVAKETDDMIPSIIDSLPAESVMCLVNAMAFNGKWAEQFEDYQVEKDASFINSDGSESKVNMLSGSEYGYFEFGDGYGFKKDYEGCQYSFVGIEVSDEIGVSDYVAQLAKDPEGFSKAIDLDNLNYDKDVIIRMPEFTDDFDIELSDVLKDMGVQDVFDNSKSDFSGLFDDTDSVPYSVDKVIHKTHIEVDKNGTKAAAATAIELTEGAILAEEKETIEINLDHPFVYAIVDNRTNLPIFIGYVNHID